MNGHYDLNCSRGNMSIFFVIGFPNPRPYTTHQFIMVFCTIVESSVRFSERVSLLSGSDQVSFRRESGDYLSYIPTTWIVAHRFFSHVNHLIAHVTLTIGIYSSPLVSFGVITKSGTLASIDCPSSQ